MNQLESSHVAAALSELEKAEPGSADAPLLTAEQRDVFARIAAESDPVAKARKTVELAEDLMQQAARIAQKGTESLELFGIGQDDIERFLRGDRLDGDAQRAVGETQASFLAQVKQQVERESQLLMGETASARAGGGRRVRGVRV